MATIKESTIVECRNVEEYYDLVDEYKGRGFEVIENDSLSLDFVATRTSKIWEPEK